MAELGVTEAQVAELESVLPHCRNLIENYPRLDDARDEARRLLNALSDIKLILNAKHGAKSEILNRWHIAAYLRGHPIGTDPEFATKLAFDKLIEAAKEINRSLLEDKQRRPRTANIGPIRLIHDALLRGWTKSFDNPPKFIMAPRDSAFRDVVQFCYETIGFKKDFSPERALRDYQKWCEAQQTSRLNEQAEIGGNSVSAEVFDRVKIEAEIEADATREASIRHTRPSKN